MALCALALGLAPRAHAASASWNVNANGNWTSNANWTAANPSATTDFATFGAVTLTASRTVTLNANRSIAGLVFTNNTAFSYTLSGSNTLTLNNAAGLTQNGSGTVTLAPTALALATNQTWGGTGTGLLTVSGPVTGNATLTKTGAYTLLLTGANTFTGNLTINAGTLRISGDSALGNANNDLTLNGGTLHLYNNTTLANNRTLTLGSSGGTIDVDGGRALTLSPAGQLLGSGTLTKTGAGNLYVSSANTGYTGATQIDSGTLRMSNREALGTSDVTVETGATLELRFGSSTNSTLGDITLNGGTLQRTYTGNQKTGLAGTLTVNASSTLADTSSDNGNGYLSIEGPVNVNNASTLTVTAAAANANITFAGPSTTPITLSAGSTLSTTGTGTVRFGNAGNGRNLVGQGTSAAEARILLGATTHTVDNATRLQVNGSGTGGLRIEGTKARVDLLATDARLASLTGTGGTLTLAYTDAGSRTLGTSANLASASTLQLGLSSAGGTFTLGTAGGAVPDLGHWGGLVVSGANTTVSFADNNVFAATANLTLLGGTLALNGTTQTFASLSVTGNSILDFGGGASTLSVGSLSIAAGAILTVNNWTASVDYFLSQLDPGSANLSRIVFTGYAGSPSWFSYDKQISPVPEPSAYGLLLAAAGLATHLLRRHRNRRTRTPESP